jgi:hypothetical protein
MASEGFLLATFKFLLPFVPLILAGYYVYTAIQTWLPLRHIPGPLLGKFSYLFMIRTQASGAQHLRYRAADQKFGTLRSASV